MARSAQASKSRSRRPTRLDVARAAGVSPATVSLALNDHPRVTLATRQRVAQVADRLGFSFTLNAAARRLARSRFAGGKPALDQVGLIYLSTATQPVDSGCMAMMREAEHQLAQAHACLVFARVAEHQDWAKIQGLAQRGVVDGLLVTGLVDDAALRQLRKLKLPMVVLGDHHCSKPVHAVNVDHLSMGRLAAQHLAELGHQRIAYIGGSQRYLYQQHTLDGFTAAVQELGLDDNPRLRASHAFWSDLSANSLMQWLADLGDRPTAIFCAEMKAQFVLRALRLAGLAVPQQISLLGCEPSAPAPGLDELSFLEVPLGEMGRHGARLLQQLAVETSVVSSDIRLAAHLVRGTTTAAPPPVGAGPVPPAQQGLPQ